MKITVNCAREGKWWVAWAHEFPGLAGRGETPEEAVANLEDAIRTQLDEMDDEFLLDMMILEDMVGEW